MCGLTGIVSIKNRKYTENYVHVKDLNDMAAVIRDHGFTACRNSNISFENRYLGGNSHLDAFYQKVRALKQDTAFAEIFSDKDIRSELAKLGTALSGIIDTEAKLLSAQAGRLRAGEVDVISKNIEQLKDIAWCLDKEILENVRKVRELFTDTADTDGNPPPSAAVTLFRKVNAVLNSLDRLEVRGRDSAGISMMFVLSRETAAAFKQRLENANLLKQFDARSGKEVLGNMSISVNHTAMTYVYKTAAEIGSLGDNVAFLRQQIKHDVPLQILITFPHEYHTVLSHTRWASVGAITEPNCHPVDNKTLGTETPADRQTPIIHVCLNGDIDNYLELKEEYEHDAGRMIPKEITTDTKIIPLQIEKYIRQGHSVEEAFRLAMNDFRGSHAVSMHTDLAPGKLFLAQKGSGQAVFVGLAENHYMPASEVYGFIEETSYYLKAEGEKTAEGRNGKTQGQIFILNQESRGGLDGIRAMFYDGTPIALSEKDIKRTEITSRDIDRQTFPHYFLKEISESPVSVERTLQNRWKVKDGGGEILRFAQNDKRGDDQNDSGDQQYVITLDEKVVPESLRNALTRGKIRQIFFVGQGTAGVAAQACADIMTYYMNDPSLFIRSLKASEMSGFKLDDCRSMDDTLVVAITQSGTTADTNRAVVMAKERGAHTLAIVNRRDSDITFKVGGVMYTSSGRDIEMSVASTKAFYSQIVAGAMLGLFMAGLKGARNDAFITEEIRQMQKLPDYMRKILAMREQIEESARRIAVTRTYWAVVGSGPNKTAADEIRIKLSELCYKTISSDFVEDKKHIDLSSEPLIIVCAAGTRDTVIGDIIKDTAIFHAHKALPVVIADMGESRFDTYCEDIFHVPLAGEHFAPIVNTLVGHIWGYYAALAINEGSRFFFKFREEIQADIEEYATKGMDVYELILEKDFREKIARFYNAFRKKRAENRLPVTMVGLYSDLTLLLKYLSGRLPVSDFELDFSVKGTAMNMLDTLMACLGKLINLTARPVDAIKHQAKTVTVGTSRISEKTEGILFDALTAHDFKVSQLTASNILVLKNLQGVISAVKGATLYRIASLNLLGEPTEKSTIEVIKKEGTSLSISSRVERDNILKGTKRIIVREGNVYIGKGRKDERSIVVIPIISASPSTPNMIEYLLLLNITFKENVALSVKIKALGGKYERIKNIVQESSAWDDNYLERVEISELFGKSAEKTGEFILEKRK